MSGISLTNETVNSGNEPQCVAFSTETQVVPEWVLDMAFVAKYVFICRSLDIFSCLEQDLSTWETVVKIPVDQHLVSYSDQSVWN